MNFHFCISKSQSKGDWKSYVFNQNLVSLPREMGIFSVYVNLFIFPSGVACNAGMTECFVRNNQK